MSERTAAEASPTYSSATDCEPPYAPGEIVLAGHFEPAAIAPLLPDAKRSQVARLAGPPGVPIHNLARGFAQRGIKTTLLGGLRDASFLQVHGDPVSAVIYNKRGSRAFTLTGFRREQSVVLDYLRQTRPAIVHAHWTMEAARAVADWPGPKVLTVHDALFEYVKLGWQWHPGAIAYKARWIANTLSTLKKFDHIIAVSPFVETYLRLRHHFPGEIRVIPNGVPPLPLEIRPVEAFPKTGRLTFGCYGGPDPLKNVKAAMEALRIFDEQVPGSRLLVFGDGWNKLAQDYQKGSIELRGSLGHSSFLRSLASEVDILIHPSRIEAHPLTICEAIQAGCPVIAGKASGGTAWTLDYGSAGLLVDIEKPKEIAEAMLSLVRHPEHVRRLVSNGRDMIRRRFAPDRVLDLHLQFYQDVIDEWNTKAKLA